MKKGLILLAFTATYVVWGTTYLAINFGLEGFQPFLLSALRYFIAGTLLVVICWIRKTEMPKGRDLILTMASGTIMLVGGSGLIVWAEQYIHSGQAAVIIATEPFMFILLDRKNWSFYFGQKMIIIGLMIGFAGIVLFMFSGSHHTKSGVSNGESWMANIVVLVSAVLWVLGSLWSKTIRNKKIPVLATSAVQLIAAGLFAGFMGLILGENFHDKLVTPKAFWSLAYLIVFGSILAYLAFNWLLTVRPPAQVSTHTYVNPVIAMLSGWFFAREPLTFGSVVGLIVVLAGVILTNTGKQSLPEAERV